MDLNRSNVDECIFLVNSEVKRIHWLIFIWVRNERESGRHNTHFMTSMVFKGRFVRFSSELGLSLNKANMPLILEGKNSGYPRRLGKY